VLENETETLSRECFNQVSTLRKNIFFSVVTMYFFYIFYVTNKIHFFFQKRIKKKQCHQIIKIFFKDIMHYVKVTRLFGLSQILFIFLIERNKANKNISRAASDF